MKLVVVESPFGYKDVSVGRRNVLYLRFCLRDSLERGEAPYASHAIFPQPNILNDANPIERSWGIQAGFAWGKLAELCAVYEDLGISEGMRLGIERAQAAGQSVDFRKLPLLLAQKFEKSLEDDAGLWI